jgi:hypothetical protein
VRSATYPFAKYCATINDIRQVKHVEKVAAPTECSNGGLASSICLARGVFGLANFLHSGQRERQLLDYA